MAPATNCRQTPWLAPRADQELVWQSPGPTRQGVSAPLQTRPYAGLSSYHGIPFHLEPFRLLLRGQFHAAVTLPHFLPVVMHIFAFFSCTPLRAAYWPSKSVPPQTTRKPAAPARRRLQQMQAGRPGPAPLFKASCLSAPEYHSIDKISRSAAKFPREARSTPL